jgi:hypothetical protein
MNSGSNPAPFILLPWSKEWTACIQAGLLWKCQEW